MILERGTRTGRILRAAGGIGCGFVCLWGFYAILWPDQPLDALAAVYSVATVGMACFITWNLGKMMQHTVDGLFAPHPTLSPAPAEAIVKPKVSRR